MKSGVIKPVAEVCNVEYGTRVVRKRDGGGVYPVYGGGGATFQMNESNREDRLVIGRFGMSEGCTRFVAGRFFLNDSGLTVSPRGGALLQRFLDYQMLSMNDAIYALGKGAAQKNLDVPAFRGLSVFVPDDLDEQRRIVGVLDEAFAAIATARANTEQNMRNAREVFVSHLQSVFATRGEEWGVKRIEEIAQHSLGKMLDKAKNRGELKPYLRNLNVRWLAFDLSDMSEMRFLPEEAAKYMASKGDVLVCEGGYPGRAAIWDEDHPIHFQKALHRVRFHEPEHNKWFVYYLLAQDQSGDLKQHFGGTGIQHFTGEVLARFEIPIPPILELRRAVSKFDELSTETERLGSIHQRKLAALDALKQSLLHQAFTGAL